jgi:hypothetical protein
MNSTVRSTRFLITGRFAFPVLGFGLIAFSLAGCAAAPVETFVSPEAAMQAVAELIGSGDAQRRNAIFGEDSEGSFASGDDVADQTDAARVKAMIQEKVAFEDGEDGSKLALLGKDGWPFPIPIVPRGDRWGFDPEAGLEEINNRRVGHNELSTIATLRALVEAQREYASIGRDGNPPAYAAQWRSTPGRHDGLYWEAGEGEPESPLGPLVAEAGRAGYRRSEDGEPQPYHGYLFRLLTKQGRSAPGGERSYTDGKGLLRRGFGVLAWPARYGNSGIMTFQVNQQGIVFQKDLGEATEEAAAAIDAYSPDASWDPVED